MTSYFERLVDFVGTHPQLSFLAVFLLALSEAVPVIGTVVPGSALILAISALATTAGITPWALLVAAVLGAIAGDAFSFWLGHRYHRQILSGWPLNRFPSLIERSAQFIRKYGITSVFLARFTAVVRAFVPLLAGIMRMSSRQFYVANILSALVWAPMHVFPGVLLGLAIVFGGAHAPQLSLAAAGRVDIGLDRLEHDQTQDRRRFGVRSQPTGARIRRTQIFPAVHFPGKPHWTAGSLGKQIRSGDQ
jgi:membrane protein DedA with SNARE-associated domain